MRRIKVGKHYISDADSVFILPEAGVNHNGSLKRAKDLIQKAAEAGAQGIKFQTYKAETLVTKSAPRFWDWEGEQKKEGTQFDSYSILDKLPWHAYKDLSSYANELGIEFISTPFDEKAVDMLDALGSPAFKIASSDLTYLPFLRYVAKKGKPIFLSTGAATLGEVEEAIRTIEAAGNRQIVVMHCTLCYPTEPKDANLRIIQTLRRTFGYPVGLSDHTMGTAIPPAAVALGARLIEKHYTVDKTLGLSADHWLSIDPIELKQIVEHVKQVQIALGTDEKRVFPAEEHTYLYDKRSLVSTQAIKKGEEITTSMLTGKRPGTGIPTKFFDLIVGSAAQLDIPEDTTLTWDMVTQRTPLEFETLRSPAARIPEIV
ncbi:N-acetylneuraminate synthase family protein [Candidatus Berkelbacteria bacterium]|nr:N-acetylneuraminate synthase family protein [Candidatus Berkelbacteria bacterium]